MSTQKGRATIPYAILLAIAVALYVVTGDIDYSERPGLIGPTVWPLFAITIIVAVCLFEIAKIFSSKPLKEPHGIADTFEKSDDQDETPRRPRLLLAGLALTIAYGLLISVLGFVMVTFIYLIAFMYLGGYRVHVAIWLSGFIGTVFLAIIFLRVVYVSLPRGVPPFSRLTDLIVNLF